MDRVNQAIVEHLQHDARMSISDLARAVDRAESTVRERVANLQRKGVILGYRAVVDKTKLGYGVEAALRGEVDLSRVGEISKRLEEVPEVTYAYLTTGAKPVHVGVVAMNLDHLEHLLEGRIAPLGIQGLEMELIVQNLIGRRPVHVPAGADGASPASGNGERTHAVTAAATS
jgi:DNA-binding Lrp family transcriptional regulator